METWAFLLLLAAVTSALLPSPIRLLLPCHFDGTDVPCALYRALLSCR